MRTNTYVPQLDYSSRVIRGLSETWLAWEAKRYKQAGGSLPNNVYHNHIQAMREVDSNMLSMRNGYYAPNLEEAFQAANFPNALNIFIQVNSLPGYQTRNFNFEAFMPDPIVVESYKEVATIQDRSSTDDLVPVRMLGTQEEGKMYDAVRRDVQVYEFAKVFKLDAKALLQDRFDYLTGFARKMGEAARRTKEKYVSRLMTNATSVAYITSLGANYFTTSTFSHTALVAASLAFNRRFDLQGQPISASLGTVIYHPSAKYDVGVVLQSMRLPGGDFNDSNLVANGQGNFNFAFTPVENPHFISPTDSPWIALASSGTNIFPFVLAKLLGRDTPWIARKKNDIESITSMDGSGVPVNGMVGDFAHGEIHLKVSDVWGSYTNSTHGNVVDPNGVFFSDGTTP